MMGRGSQDQGQLFYSFNLEEVVPDDHLVRAISRVLDLAWVRAELAPHYSPIGRRSVDPVLILCGGGGRESDSDPDSDEVSDWRDSLSRRTSLPS
jgi:hypothetical protein